MKILLINHQIRPELSGVASHFENISNNLVLLGNEVVRLVAKDPNFNKGEPGIEYLFFEYRKKKQEQTESENNERIQKNYADFEKVLKERGLGDVDAVITSNDIYVSILKKYIATNKIISIIPSSLAFSSHSNPTGYKEVIERLKVNSKDVKLVVLSQKMKSMLSHLLGNDYDISVVTPGVNKDKFSISSKKRRGNSILFVGRIAEEKNIPALIEAMKKVKTPCSLRIVGAGTILDTVKELARGDDRIIFEGRTKHVENYYANADIFVFPSKYEAFGLVILEAMASELPVIAFHPSDSILTASDEIITDSLDGFLVHNTSEMAEKIDLLLTNSQLRKSMGEKALHKAELFIWENHVKSLLDLLETPS